ncbi:DUF3108 domain-containing protein [Pseudotabrizicola algicola]|uniref:DUF3108 domain-containing protein n=1 Tax=Pseudotabrizicola algicola TaxID=2709381 RepID=A0A6B3RMK1_9RHOB|nr:DUF3108 domain-containing protein [Pseudotabrizicola algicola]NEX47314.1 DUF3108 domain-containing protein [Pseudotabrizicola algicola]
MLVRSFALGLGLMAQCLAAPVQAQEASELRYTISVSGLTAGKLVLAAQRGGGSYALSANTASAGLAGLLRSFSLTTRAKGSERGGRLMPQHYAAKAEGARQGRGAELAFADGVATVIKADARPGAAPVVDPSQHKGAIDPLTGLYTVLRDTDRDSACQLDFKMFDGHRISRVIVGSPQAEGEGLVCQGVYRRVDGYPAKELAKRSEFPFEVVYRPAADGTLQVAEVSMDSLFGPARMVRDD